MVRARASRRNRPRTGYCEWLCSRKRTSLAPDPKRLGQLSPFPFLTIRPFALAQVQPKPPPAVSGHSPLSVVDHHQTVPPDTPASFFSGTKRAKATAVIPNAATPTNGTAAGMLIAVSIMQWATMSGIK